ncbi:MAG: CvpA family protein, partial [Elusimicrobia bacterium]|nr:CvpA family protein [Elusimicrobiota bacterium]
MSLDLWILAGLALFGALGFFTGAIRQISHWIGLAAAYFLSKPLAARAAPPLAAREGWPPHATAVGLAALLMPVLLVAAGLGSRALIDALVPGKERNVPDRVAGLALGAGKAAALAWLALSVVLPFQAPLARRWPAAGAALDASRA